MNSTLSSIIDGNRLRWTSFVGDDDVEDEGLGPETRSFHSCSLVNDSILVLFGGVTQSSENSIFVNDVWVRCLRENTGDGLRLGKWLNDRVVFSGTKNVPSPRCRHSAVTLQNGVYIFGGTSFATSEEMSPSSLYLLETLPDARFRWVKLLVHGDAPPPRFGHTACALSSQSFLIFGGRSIIDGSDLDDFHVYDALRNVWFPLDVTFTSPSKPSGTACALFPLKDGLKGALLVSFDSDEIGLGHQSESSVVSVFVLSDDNPKQEWRLQELTVKGARINASKQASSHSFSQQLGLVDLDWTDQVISMGNRSKPMGQNAGRAEEDEGTGIDMGLDQSFNSLNSQSSGLLVISSSLTPSVYPSDRWFPSIFKLGEYIYCFGGIAKESGWRGEVQFAWRFIVDEKSLSTRKTTWEIVRLEDASSLKMVRLGWSLCVLSSEASVLVFGGTEVRQSYIDDVARDDDDVDGFDPQRLPEKVIRRFTNEFNILRSINLSSSAKIVVSEHTYTAFEENYETLASRVNFASSNIAARFMSQNPTQAPMFQNVPSINAVGNKRPNALNSMHSFKVFDANVIWSVAWDLSLYMFVPNTLAPVGHSLTPKTLELIEGHEALPVIEGVWTRLVKPLVLPSPSSGTDLDFLGSELSVLWPDDHREGFALERFSPYDSYTLGRKFDKMERAFDGDVLVLMGGIRTQKERSKAAKVFGVGGKQSRQGEESVYFNDLWIAYSTHSSRRNFYCPPTASLVSWKKLWPPSEASDMIIDMSLLQGRAKHTLTALPSLGLLAAFGGITDRGLAPSAQLILIDFTARGKEFTYAHLHEPLASGTPPEPRFNHAAASTPGETPRLVIAGGQSVANPTNFLKDVFVWEVITGVWTLVAADVPFRGLGWLHQQNGSFYYFFSEEYSDEPVESYLKMQIT